MARPEYLEWLSYARDDLETAEYLLGMKPRKIEIICYHCEQCAEKALKAVLAFYEEEIPRSHDLRLLMKHCRERAPAIDRLADLLPVLQPFAVSVRYPYETDVAEGDEIVALEHARNVFHFIQELMAE